MTIHAHTNRLDALRGAKYVVNAIQVGGYDPCTITDFENFCGTHDVRILERIVISGGNAVTFLPNLLGSLAVFRFERA